MPVLEPAIDPTLSVNELLKRYPAAVRVLNAFGVDTCCGGATALDVAAREAGLQVEDITTAIAAVIASPTRGVR
jgi:iron-sulfur cluster repair protein YtfE (RIC family)